MSKNLLQYPAAKVIVNDEVILDVSRTTASTKEIAKGFVIVSNTGNEIEGTLQTNIFTRNIYQQPVDIPTDTELTWFTSLTDAMEDVHVHEEIVYNGDFLVIYEYFAIDENTYEVIGTPALSTYVANINDDDEIEWVEIGAATLVDGNTCELVDGKVSLLGSSQLQFTADKQDNEFIPYVVYDEALGYKLVWKESATLIDKIEAIETFFNSLDDNQTGVEILEKIDELNAEIELLRDKEDSLQAAIDDEYTRATLAEEALNTNITDAYNATLAAISSESMRATEAEDTLAEKLIAEQQRAIVQETSLQKSIQAEEQRASFVEQQLQQQIEALDTSNSTTYYITEHLEKTQMDAVLSYQKYDKFVITTSMAVIYDQIKPGHSFPWYNQLSYVDFDMSKVKSDITIVTDKNVRLNSILRITLSSTNNYIPTISGDYSGIEIIGTGEVILHNVTSIGQVAGLNKTQHLSENVKGIGGVVVKGKVQSYGSIIESNVKLHIKGQVYLEGAINADGLSIQGGTVEIDGDNLTAIGNHGYEDGGIVVKDQSYFTNKDKVKLPDNYYLNATYMDEYGEYYPGWTQQTATEVTTMLKDSGGAGIGCSNVAAKEISISENNTSGQIGYGYYTKREYALAHDGEQAYTISCGKIIINNLAFLKAEGYGLGASGIGGGTMIEFSEPNYSDSTQANIQICNVTHLSVRGGYVERTFIIDRANEKKEQEIGWTVGPLGGPGIGYVLRDKPIRQHSILLEHVYVAQCYGGNQSAGIGSGYYAEAVIWLKHCTIANVTGGAGAAAIGSGRINNNPSYVSDILTLINITDSTIEARGGEYGASIGSGYTSNRTGTEPTMYVTITGSSIKGMPGRYAAGIGSGYLAGVGDVCVSKDSQIIIKMDDTVEGMIWPASWGDWAGDSTGTIIGDYRMPWTIAQEVGSGVQDIMTGARSMTSLALLSSNAEHMYNGTCINAKSYKTNDTGIQTLSRELIPLPLHDIPWIGEPIRNSANSALYQIYVHTPYYNNIPTYGLDSSDLNAIHSDAVYDASESWPGLKYWSLSLEEQYWKPERYECVVTAKLTTAMTDFTSALGHKAFTKTYTFDFPNQQPSDLSLSRGIHLLRNLGLVQDNSVTETGDWVWYGNSNYFVQRNNREIVCPDGYNMEITCVEGFEEDMQGTEVVQITLSNQEPLLQPTSDEILWSTWTGSRTLTLTSGNRYQVYISNPNEGYPGEYTVPDILNTAKVRIRYCKAF